MTSRFSIFRVILALMAGFVAFGASAQGTSSSSARAEYVLGAGDVVHIAVYQNPDLSLDARVSEAGNISYPLIGGVTIGGLTVQQAEKRIADALRSGNFVKRPQVSILVTQVRGNQASVLGNVNRAGRYPLEVADMRLTDVLAMAGGVSTTGSDIVTLIGERNGKPYRVHLDLPRVFSSNQPEPDLIVKNGDIIWVDRAPMVYIYGQVQRPGAIRLERGMSVIQLLATGGGLTQRGTEKGMRLHRRGPDGKVQILEPSMDEPLRDGDVVYVRESLF